MNRTTREKCEGVSIIYVSSALPTAYLKYSFSCSWVTHQQGAEIKVHTLEKRLVMDF
jgi:hypothetical protein